MVKLQIELEIENNQKIIVCGDEVQFLVDKIYPKHVMLAANVAPLVRDIIKVMGEYRKNNSALFPNKGLEAKLESERNFPHSNTDMGS